MSARAVITKIMDLLAELEDILEEKEEGFAPAEEDAHALSADARSVIYGHEIRKFQYEGYIADGRFPSHTTVANTFNVSMGTSNYHRKIVRGLLDLPADV